MRNVRALIALLALAILGGASCSPETNYDVTVTGSEEVNVIGRNQPKTCRLTTGMVILRTDSYHPSGLSDSYVMLSAKVLKVPTTSVGTDLCRKGQEIVMSRSNFLKHYATTRAVDHYNW